MLSNKLSCFHCEGRLQERYINSIFILFNVSVGSYFALLGFILWANLVICLVTLTHPTSPVWPLTVHCCTAMSAKIVHSCGLQNLGIWPLFTNVLIVRYWHFISFKLHVSSPRIHSAESALMYSCLPVISSFVSSTGTPVFDEIA